MSENRRLTTNYSVAAYLTCGWVVNTQITKGLLLCLPEKFFQPMNIWQSYQQEGGCLAQVVTTLLKIEENARHNPHFCP